jgi:hypothetical protein
MAARRKKTVGQVEDLLKNLYQRLAQASKDPPSGQGANIGNAMNAVEWVLGQIDEQHLHHDAEMLRTLRHALDDATDKLRDLKATLKQMADAAALGAALLNTIASVIPLL